ncbi:EAL domain-containing protein [Shewanella sp. SR44-3]|uniref:bifunctional diguanylate cyclase/phosphodiesterase n=1 Tax=unclassified Shewanella TaxID=196818 RepID=UPI0015F7B4AD|nr:EAL domain-containing protein [Shewanella sp. SR44-3]MBB1267966.1 EAL domain-containing protein [Shewanella sp. SR44-3]
MEFTEHQELLEIIVNSDAKALGQYTQTANMCCQLLLEQFQAFNVTVWHLHPQDNHLTPVASADLSSQSPLASDFKPIISPEYQQHLHDHRFFVAIDVSNAPFVSTRYLEDGSIKQLLDVAIRINGHIEGLLSIEFDSVIEWHEHDIQFVSQVADQLALALATERGYEKDEDLTLYLSATEQADHLIILVNLKTQIIKYVNPAHYRLTGLPREQVQDQHVNKLDFFRGASEQVAPMVNALLKGETLQGERLLVRSDQSEYWVQYHARHFLTPRGNDYALVAVHDISSQYRHKAELERLAWNCNLTGLHNRLHFTRSLDKCAQGVLFLVDLLGFNRFNDTHGHERGDALLIEVARRVKHFARFHNAIDVARIGSDEFGILLPEVQDLEQLEHFVKSLYDKLLVPVVIGRNKVEPKPAIAVVNIACVVDLFAPLSCADIALQHAKRKALKHYQIFNTQLLEAFKANIEIERDLQHALKGREFELYYQPLMDLKTQQYIGAEALIRWNHPKKGVLYPGAFIEIAEQTGLINAMGNWVLETACKQLHLWQHKNIDLTMHVNVSARQFFSGQLYSQVWTLVTRYRIKPKRLILEITETELMSDIDHATRLCKELAELGVGLAIDDFGTGHSSMRYLKQFPISKLKIDRSFVMDISSSHESREIVSAIIAMASALNISLTAEGVETKEQEAFLTLSACHHAQGFLYSPAVRESEFSHLLELHRSKAQSQQVN